MSEKVEQNRDIVKNVPLFGCRKLKIGTKVERNRDIAKNIPLFWRRKLKMSEKAEQQGS